MNTADTSGKSREEGLQVLHGLPREVIYCKRCVMSNQRPATHPEFTKKSTSDTPVSSFGDDGICDACRYNEMKKTFDWDDRGRQLRDLCDRFRRTDGRYDVIVPGSGGKDSIFVAHKLKFEYGMNPLCVTWAPHAYTDVGWRNLQAWQRVGHDHILFTPNPKVHAILTCLAFDNLLNPFQPFILGQKLLAPRMALKFGVQFIMYGENQAEIHNSLEGNFTSLMDPAHFTCKSHDDPLYFGGVERRELKEYGVDSADMAPYLPMLLSEIEAAGIEEHFMSYFVHWSPQQNYYFAKEVSEFESNPDGRSEGTYSKYASLDDKIDGQNYYTMMIKFGQGRTISDACRDIRDGYISREEGVALARRYDTEFPRKHFRFFLDYLGITENHYWQKIEENRSAHLWKKDGNSWVMRHPPE